jgi:hypothetical protein
MTQTISTVYAIPAGACGSKPLSFVTYKQTSPAVIK